LIRSEYANAVGSEKLAIIYLLANR